MRTVEIVRTGNASVADQMAEMQGWLCEAGIQPLTLDPMRILNAQVRFRASFANDADAERFRGRFNEEGAGEPG
jgi:hypothetical protein